MRHSPAPWKLVQEAVDPCWHVITAPGGRIMVNVHLEEGNPMDAANARLIVAAPEMNEMLRLAQVRVFMAEGRSELYERFNALIDKIDGKAVSA